MASRGPFGLRARHTEKEDRPSKIPQGLSRKTSITTKPAPSVKSATHTPSFFSRNKQPKPKAESSAPAPVPLPSSLPVGRGQTTVSITSTASPLSVQSQSGSARDAGLGISMENKTAQTSKSGRTRNVLRRKAPTIESKGPYARTESSASSYDVPSSQQAVEAKASLESPPDPFPNQILGVTAPPTSSSSGKTARAGFGPSYEHDTSNSRMARYNSRKTPSPSPHPNALYSTPNYTLDSGSSTRCSDSPSGLSHSSTPTSMTSQSPAISTPASIPSARSAPKVHGQTRPPTAFSNKKSKPLVLEPSSRGLAAVRESGTSSSSSSTVKASGSRDESSRLAILDRTSPSLPLSAGSTSSRAGFSPEQDASLSNVARRASSERAGGSPLIPRGNTPPIRPSRDGVPNLEMNKIQLDFSVPRPTALPLGRSPSSASSTATQRPRLAAPAQIITGKTSKPSPASSVHEFPKVDTKGSSSRATRAPSPQDAASSKLTSRFNLFSRRTRSPMESSAGEATDKSSRKGPAAGTGHEGYGKYARRGRSGSLSTSASRGRSTSSNSIGRSPSSRKSSLTSRDEDQMDEFYRSRLEPKKIVGGGQSVASPAHGSDLLPEATGQSSVSALSTSDSKARDTSVGHLDMQESAIQPGSKTAHALRHVDRRLPVRSGQPSPATGSSSMKTSAPTLATRRSLHRSQNLKGPDPVRIPAPIDTRVLASPSGLDSQNTDRSMLQTDNTVPLTDDVSEGHEGNWLKPAQREKTAKSPKKWSFFHRSQESPKKTTIQAITRPEPESGPAELRAQVSRLPEKWNLAYYELMNPIEPGETGNTSEVSVETNSESAGQPPLDPSLSDTYLAIDADGQHKLSILLPSPPKLTAEFPDLPAPSTTRVPDMEIANSQTAAPASAANTEPAVIPPEPRKPRLQQIGRIPRVVSKRDRPHNPPPQSFSRLRPFMPRQEAALEAPAAAAPATFAGERLAEGLPTLGLQTTGIATTYRDSQDSGKPASAPVEHMVGKSTVPDEFLTFPPRIASQVSASTSSGNMSAVDITAIVPQPGAALTEEEEWNEYNDFLDIMESPAPLANPKVNPYEKTLKAHGWAPTPLDIRKGSSSGSSRDSARREPSVMPLAMPPTRKLPSPPKKSKRADSPSKRVISDEVDEPASSKDNEEQGPQRKSLAASSRYSTSSIESDADTLAGQDNPYQAKVDVPTHLRLELLTISKLLSFDRVLFSPAHAEVSGNRKSRILVLDGLGVDDWAFFCAQEYPEAQISNLSGTSRTAVSARNYEHHYYPTLDGPFPFPQNYFNAAVLRFPVATAEGAYSNVIKEFRRVLCPGGYLEISVLDLDMVKMGSQTRRALRGFKERKKFSEPQVSLKPLSDTIQKMLGGKAFENLKQCMLEIPVANSVGSSRVRSFNEKMELLDEMPSDEDRTKHLPEIGRWWFSRCYEAGPKPSRMVSTSIWDDKTILEECEAMQTGFKMLLCYAQKPDKRRTLSL